MVFPTACSGGGPKDSPSHSHSQAGHKCRSPNIGPQDPAPWPGHLHWAGGAQTPRWSPGKELGQSTGGLLVLREFSGVGADRAKAQKEDEVTVRMARWGGATRRSKQAGQEGVKAHTEPHAPGVTSARS